MNQILWIGLCCLLIACNQNNKPTVHDATVDSIVVDKNEADSVDLKKVAASTQTINDYWSEFQDAVAQKDIQKLMAMSDSNYIKADLFDDLFFDIFFVRIPQADSSELKLSETDENVYEYAFEEIPEQAASDEESEGFGASLYFRKNKDGKFVLFKMLAFG